MNIVTIIQRNVLVDTLYFGDTFGDQMAADKADIPFIHAAYGFGKPHMPCPAIEFFSGLLSYIALPIPIN